MALILQGVNLAVPAEAVASGKKFEYRLLASMLRGIVGEGRRSGISPTVGVVLSLAGELRWCL